MSTMHDAVRRLAKATETRQAHHRTLVTSHLQGRAEHDQPAGQHAPSGPAFPLPAQDRTEHGGDPEGDRNR